MAKTLKTVVTYPLDGQTVDFAIPFDYLARKFVKVTLLGQVPKELVLNVDYRFATRKTISLTRPWGSTDGYDQLEMRRYTSATERLVDFTDGSILRAYDLNVAQLQTMHIAEEARDLTADTVSINNDGDLDARGHRIVNLGVATGDDDAVSLGTLKGLNSNAWQARNDAEKFRNEAAEYKELAAAEVDKAAAEVGKAAAEVGKASDEVDKAAAEVGKAAAEVGKAADEVGKAKQWADKAASEVSKAAAEVGKAAAEVDKAKQWADKAGAEVGKVQQEVGKVNEAIEKAKEQVSLAEASSVKVQQMAEQVKEDARDADAYAQEARREADRAAAEADKVAATNQISAALESVTSTAVTFNREVASRSHLRCMTTGGSIPFTGVWRERVAELYMAVDSSGNAGFTTGAPSGSLKFKAYWDTQGATYVSTTTMNLDQGSRQIKGSLEVGHGSNSAIHTFSNGEGTPNELVSATKWKWHDGGVELGAVRGGGSECSGIMKTTSGGKSVTYKQDAGDGSHKFLGHTDKTVLTIHKDGDIETPLLGRLSEKLSGVGGGGGGSGGGGGDSDGDVGNTANWKLVGTISDEEGSSFISKFPLTGRRGYIKFVQGNGVTVNVFFTYPPFDCIFQLPRGSSSGTFMMRKSGQEMRLRVVSEDKWGDIYQFYAYNPGAQALDYPEEVDTEYGVF